MYVSGQGARTEAFQLILEYIKLWFNAEVFEVFDFRSLLQKSSNDNILNY